MHFRISFLPECSIRVHLGRKVHQPAGWQVNVCYNKDMKNNIGIEIIQQVLPEGWEEKAQELGALVRNRVTRLPAGR
jgi:hypothetical protein